jgi:hypothetical protein
MAVMYFGLLAFLVAGMRATHIEPTPAVGHSGESVMVRHLSAARPGM